MNIVDVARSNGRGRTPTRPEPDRRGGPPGSRQAGLPRGIRHGSPAPSVEQAAGKAVRGAEARERKRIIRWLRTVADVYAARFRAAKGEETVYWADQLEAFSHAADAISRRRHARPH